MSIRQHTMSDCKPSGHQPRFALVRWHFWSLLPLFVLGIAAVSVTDGADKPPEVLAAIRRGVGFLSSTQAAAGYESGLVAYAMISGGESPDSPAVKAHLDSILRKCTTAYRPDRHFNYEAGVDAMALTAADKDKYKPQVKLIAEFLLANQKPHGSWDYATEDYKGDTSITQYGMLGLWAAQRTGFEVPPRVWDDAAQWHFQTQLKDGGFSYHPVSGDLDPKHSMAVAGAGSLAIARLMLSRINPPDPEATPKDPAGKPAKSNKAFGVLERVNAADLPDQAAATPVADGAFRPKSSSRQLNDGIGRSMAWLSRFYTIDKPTGWHLYYLYGLERVGSLTNTEKINGHDWYKEGCSLLIKKQNPDGSFTDLGGPVASTCFALLFMARATEKLVPQVAPPKPTPKAPTFGGGQMAGGRGLPTALADVEVKDGTVTTKKVDTPLDKLLAELENPKSQKIEAAQDAIVEAVQLGQREQLIGKKDLLLKLAKDSRVDVRRTAFWALARCNDLRVAPVLIQGLMDADFDAAVEARNALCVLSRRPRGFGLPDDLIAKLPEGASQAEKDAAFERWRDEDVRRWREWYQSVRPYAERDKLPD